MKKFLLFVFYYSFLAISPFYLYGQSSEKNTTAWGDVTSWKNNAPNGNWNATNWYDLTQSWDNHNPNYEGGRNLLFDNNNQTVMTNDFTGNGAGRWQITFTANATAERTISGSTENTFYDNSGSKPKIENLSGSNHNINFPIKIGYNPFELNPVNGDLTMSSAINNNGNYIDVYGPNSKTLTLSGTITGTGGISLKQNSKVVLSSVDKVYTGATVIEAGTLDLRVNLSSSITVKSTASLIINGLVTIPALTIESGAIVTINTGKTLIVTGILTNGAGNNGLIIESGGSLVHNSDGIAAKVKREIASDGQWHFISCPISGSMPAICDGNFAPLTSNFNSGTGATFDFYKYSEGVASGGNVWNNIKNSDFSLNTGDFGATPLFVTGKGYLVEYKAAFAGSATKSYAGTLANGDQTIPVTVAGNKFNLIGNPFCSAIDWKAAAGWTRTVLKTDGNNGGNNIWIWNGSAGNYGTYSTTTSGDLGTNNVGRYIAPTQGFFVQAASAGNVGLTNAVRVSAIASQLKADSISESIRVQVSGNSNSYTDEVLIEFNHQSNDGGAAKWWSMYTEAPSLYIVKDNKNFSLNFLTSIAENPIVPVSFKAGTDGDYILNSSFDSNEFGSIVLHDMKTGMEQNLKSNPVYAFSATTSDDPGRFILKFGGVGISNPESYQSGIYTYNNKLYIDNPGNATLEVYNMAGQKQFSRQISSSGLFQTNLSASTGYYVVRLTFAGQVRIAKVFVK
jgi:autotransporter-associated beta strand protein